MTANKKGVLLVELCIAMAIVAIICTMTLTFTILLRQRTLLNSDRDDMLKYVSNVETAVKEWLVHYDNCDYSLSTQNSDKQLVAINTSGVKYIIGLEDDEIVGDYYDENIPNNTKSYETTDVKKLVFNISDPSTFSGKRVIKCTVYYDDPTRKAEEHIDFLFTTRANSSIIRKSE
ncbi:MAG: hypothetical protein MJ076_05845 [Clostridia bacterium]|nr:hypothetical protein [Clostridia bacterium]